MSGARPAWGVAGLLGVVCLGLGVALLRAQDENASLEARLVVAERAAEAPPSGASARRGKAGKARRRGPLGRLGPAERAAGPAAVDRPDTGAADPEQAEAAARAARRQDAGAETRAERALAALDVAIAELDLAPETADEVRAIYEETFEEGARVRAAVRAGELDEDAARERQQALRLDARGELEALLEPDALRHIQRTIRRGGRGRL